MTTKNMTTVDTTCEATLSYFATATFIAWLRSHVSIILAHCGLFGPNISQLERTASAR